ncbi:hypothetical protein CLAFUW4_05177 [Fulvia fulva]|uniref:DUF218 domain-containing protein n=1 Tax=Passalora fulva TaxID=5499 RepID=A0A9Q8PIU6_PASFU|nr:uncharacterized protein CLAFUR5_11729 [Fulvia fulva]KAK4626044.1 hypothetical protein CLAFUR4_05163 [Fulvia fulva]KAK4628223.1 hypothetical protein CLAFUR0_05169 [Fulvia fulva]UJO23238.1 hypothetical protein CLAFUR5_11729 [Fulvia fulva]WPV13490.1 hypothetical protein CLAFUW4_05177 [Fulvia fulva]WPV28272.1 hypothetical protein CLAFUW7_05173 [Fulvia fulva]
MWSLGICLTLGSAALAGNSTAPAFEAALAQRLFPELTKFWSNNSKAWPHSVQQTIDNLRNTRQDRLAQSIGCTPEPACIIEAIKINSNDQRILTGALNASSAPASLLQVWPQYVNATNRLLEVYGNGTEPLYPEIHAISYPANSPDYKLFLETLRTYQLTEPTSIKTPPCDAIDIGLTLLDANDRDNVLYFPDLWQRQNAPALTKAKTLDWSNYNYSAILIPGFGPEIYGVPLSFLGKTRLRIAVAEFNKGGVAPFLIPSGGNVHPNKTIYNEGLEMGRWLIDQYRMDNASIALEPNARHTTTNLRNTARTLKVLGVPTDKPVLIISDKSQRNDIASESFAARCVRELGYVTGDVGPKIGDFAVEWRPNGRNEVVDPIDPLDP